MVTAEETVIATTTMEADPQTDVSGNSSDSDADKIEKLKAEQREIAGLETKNGSVDVTNGKNHDEENGDSVEMIAEAVAEVSCEANADENIDEAPQLEAENAVEEENGGGVPVAEEAATTSTTDEKDAEVVESMEVDEVEEVNAEDANGKEEEANGNDAPTLIEEPSNEDSVPQLDDEKTSPEVAVETDSKTEEPETQSTVVELDAEEEEKSDSTKEEPEVITVLDDSQPESKGVKRPVDCIQLDDDDDIQEVTPNPAKKSKVEDEEETTSVPSTTKPNDKEESGTTQETKTATKKEEVVDGEDDNTKAQERLLNKLVDYVSEQRALPSTKNRKVLDTLLGAINAQVQIEPLSVRKLILDKVLVLPNTISFPPSQVCDLLIEHDPEMPLAKVITRMFGDERPKLSDSEKRERAQLKANNAVPNMTKLLVDIGQDLVQESTYCDIVHAKNLPEVPKNLETYKQVAAQLKPVWETLKRKNEPYKLKMQRCKVCGFQTESQLVMSSHKAALHHNGSKYQCTFCKETDTNEQRMKEHLFEAHLVIATPEEKESKYPCAICEEDFNFKGVREQHYKQCKKDYIRLRNIMMPKQDDFLLLNRWLWEKPAMDPSILQQQQQAALQQAQQRKQQLITQQQQAAAAALLRKQQLQQQQQQAQANRIRENQQAQQIRQMAQLMQQNQRGNISNTLIQAMQQAAQLRRGAPTPATNALAMSQMIQKQMAAMKSQVNGAQLQAAVAAMKNSQKPAAQKLQKITGTVSASSSPAASSSAASTATTFSCEICDQTVHEKERYLIHLQGLHKQMVGKCLQDMAQGAPLACSRCRDRFWTYEGLERHLVMAHGLVTADLLLKAQKKEDGGRCKNCGKQYAFNMLQHLVADHQVKLCSAEIMYSCDVCSFKCSSYQTLEAHLTSTHPKGSEKKTGSSKKDDCITLDD